VFDTLYGIDTEWKARPQMVEGHSVEEDGLTWTLVVSRRPRPGDDRIQYRKIRDPDKDEGFRAIRSPESGRRSNRKRRRRGGF
jgi:hypothetical protein